MALTPSKQLPLGTKASDFTLLDTVSNQTKSLHDLKSDTATVIMFICNHCPFVKHIQHELVNIAHEYADEGIRFIAISSNDVNNYPDDSPKLMTLEAKKVGYPFPYLYDETQQVAKAYDAACTPDFYIYDNNLKLAYHGQLDDSRPGNKIPVTGKDIRQALDAILSGNPINPHQIPSTGCNIKWK